MHANLVNVFFPCKLCYFASDLKDLCISYGQFECSYSRNNHTHASISFPRFLGATFTPGVSSSVVDLTTPALTTSQSATTPYCFCKCHRCVDLKGLSYLINITTIFIVTVSNILIISKYYDFKPCYSCVLTL